MTVTPRNHDPSVTPTQIVQSPGSEFQIHAEVVEPVRIEPHSIRVGDGRAEFVTGEKFSWIRKAIKSGVAFASFAFILSALEKFLPSTSGVVESKLAAAGMIFIAWLKTF
jgi:hypothetical protein